MKLIGMIGGMSWQSSAEYYRLINEGVARRRGGQHSARILMYSVDFDPIERAQMEGRWDATAEVLGDAARSLARAGVDFLVLATNTMHKVADVVESVSGLPLLHIVDATAAAIGGAGVRRVGLLGTRFTMEDTFYRERLGRNFGIDTLIPDPDQRRDVHRIIYDELCHGRIEAASRQCYAEIVADLARQGAQGVILGCTEIPMLIQAEHVDVPLFDTTRLHAEAAVERALANGL